jgi:quercetin dioxygenase-like cupin family protein
MASHSCLRLSDLGLGRDRTCRTIVAEQLHPHRQDALVSGSSERSRRLAPLWGDRVKGEAGTLLSAPAGFRSGLHTHTADYWAIVVLGTWEHWVPSTSEGVGTKLEPGAFWTQMKNQPHEDACVSATPCTIFLFNKTPYVTEFPKQK